MFWFITTKWANTLLGNTHFIVDRDLCFPKQGITVFQNVIPNLLAEQDLACAESIPIRGVSISIF